MPKLSVIALKARIAQLQKQLTTAQNNKVPAIKKVMALMKKLGVSLADLSAGKFQRKGRPRRKGGKRGPRRGRRVAIKYRDQKGNTWSGRGKTPRWLAAAEKAGSKRDQFLIKK